MARANNVLQDVHLEVETAKAQRTCSAHKTGAQAHRIQIGQPYLVVSINEAPTEQEDTPAALTA